MVHTYHRENNYTQSGAVAVEASIGTLALLLLLFFILQLLLWMWRVVSLDHALANATRWATLGQTVGSLNRVDSVKETFKTEMQNALLSASDVTMTIRPMKDPKCSPDSLGVGNDVFFVEVKGPDTRLLGLYNLPLHSIAIGRTQ